MCLPGTIKAGQLMSKSKGKVEGEKEREKSHSDVTESACQQSRKCVGFEGCWL